MDFIKDTQQKKRRVKIVAITAALIVGGLAIFLLSGRGGANFLSAAVSDIAFQADPTTDPDHDGLTNEEEKQKGTDPSNPDTDGDGYYDGTEVSTSHDPLVAQQGKTLPSAAEVASATFTQEDREDLEKLSAILKRNVTVEQMVLPQIADSEIKISGASGREAIVDYEKQLATTLNNYRPFLSLQVGKIIIYRNVKEFDQGGRKAESYHFVLTAEEEKWLAALTENNQKALSELQNLAVPQAAADVHKDIIGLLRLNNDYLISINGISKDLIIAWEFLNRWQGLDTELNGYYERLVKFLGRFNVTDNIK